MTAPQPSARRKHAWHNSESPCCSAPILTYDGFVWRCIACGWRG